jgi:ribose 5-phosphate isomerase RpiB
MKIALGADHGGFDLKKELVAGLRELKYAVEDLGCFSVEPFDYPEVAHVWLATPFSRGDRHVRRIAKIDP